MQLKLNFVYFMMQYNRFPDYLTYKFNWGNFPPFL